MVKEADVQARFNKWVKILKRLELDVWHKKLSDRYQSGLPDNVLIIKGQTFWVELKRPGKKPTKIQEKQGRDIVKSGGTWMYLSSTDGVDGFFKNVVYKTKGGWNKPNFEELLNETNND